MLKRKQGRKTARKPRSAYGRILPALGVVCLAFVAVLVYPSPYKNQRGGVELIGSNPEVEIYGPEVPEAIVGGYTAPYIQSAVLPEATPDTTTVHVYATEGQENYHRYECKFAYASSKRMTLQEAYYLGYTPGPCCAPPVYTGL